MIRSVCLTIAACAFTSCAVLTIDVDVYKGPLANDEKVQVEQLTAMTMGAKPLLVQLRDRLETKNLDDLRRNREWYRADYVPPKENRKGDGPPFSSYFKNEHAEQVNAILSLYKSVFGDELTILFQAGREALNDYIKASSILSYSYKDQDPWNEFQGQFIAPGDFSTEQKVNVTSLKAGYQEFLVAPSPDQQYRSYGAKKIFEEHCKIVTALKKNKTISGDLRAKLDKLPELKLDGKTSTDCEAKFFKEASANSLFEALQDRRIVEFHSILLFKSNAKETRGKFVARTVAVSESFIDAREALARLWRLTLHFIAVVNTPEFAERTTQRQMLRTAAELAAKLTDYCHLAHFLKNRPSSGDVVAIQQLKNDKIVKYLLSNITKCDNPSKNEDFFKITMVEGFRDLISKEPERTVHALIQANTLWPDKNLTSPPLEAKHKSVEARRFGIVVGPIAGSDEIREIIPDELVGQFKQLSEGAAIGLEKGRLGSGLEELIESYLQENNKASPTTFAVEREKKRLLDALVAFAQKILMLGNFNVLFKQEGREEEVQPYVPLLQAIGNAILTHVNELQTKKTYVDVSTLRGEMEARALKAENEPDAKDAPAKGRLIQGLKLDVELPAGITNDPRQVMDLVISKLQYEHVQALRRGESKDAEHLEAAIEAASTHRANMVYIRPASFYLRNSFLFTGLQKDSPATWRNMLSEHAWRQFSSSSTDKKAQIIQEFDKQYWQNVNTVRVAGGGKTNYVIAKDDVGNWYVKNFSSDPESIIQGAKSLALFAAKGAASVDQVDRATRLLRKPIKEKVEKEVEESDTDKAERVGTKSSEGEDEENDKDDVADEVKAKGKRKKPRKAKTQQASITVQGAVMEEQRKAAETSHASRTQKMLSNLETETKGLDTAIIQAWDSKGLKGSVIVFLKKHVLESTTLNPINTDVLPKPPLPPPPTREKFDTAFKIVTGYRDEILSKISTDRFVTAVQSDIEAQENLLEQAKTQKALSEQLETISQDVAAKKKTLDEQQGKVPQDTIALNKAKLDFEEATKKHAQAAEARKRIKDIEKDIARSNEAIKVANADLEIAKTVNTDTAKSAIKPIFAVMLLKFVDQRAEDLENYRIRLRAIRSDNAG
jgi:hypothetical protein